HGLPVAEHRPHRPGGRTLHRLVRAAKLYSRARGVHHGSVADPHRPDQGRSARGGPGNPTVGPDHRRTAQAARLPAEGMKVWPEPFVRLRWPTIIDLRSDPFEKAPVGSICYSDWAAHRMFLLVPAQAYVAKWISSFKEFPPRQKPASFSVDEV